jgi:hypothetical protein
LAAITPADNPYRHHRQEALIPYTVHGITYAVRQVATGESSLIEKRSRRAANLGPDDLPQQIALDTERIRPAIAAKHV